MQGYQRRHQTIFTTIRSEGAILPMDLLQRIAQGDANLQGLTPEILLPAQNGETERGH